MPLAGCNTTKIRLIQKSSNSSLTRYKIYIESEPEKILAVMLTFSQPFHKIIFKQDITTSYFDNPMDIFIKITMPKQSNLWLDMEVHHKSNKACVLSAICVLADASKSIDLLYSDRLEKPLKYRNITAFNSTLQFKCPYGQEFFIGKNEYKLVCYS